MQASAISALCEGGMNFALRKAVLNTEPGVATALNVQDAQGQEFTVLETGIIDLAVVRPASQWFRS